MDKVKTFYNFEKIDERGQKKFKKIIAHNVFGLGEGGLVGCSNLAGCVCPLLPNPCYV
jgi:hypothetical protein